MARRRRGTTQSAAMETPVSDEYALDQATDPSVDELNSNLLSPTVTVQNAESKHIVSSDRLGKIKNTLLTYNVQEDSAATKTVLGIIEQVKIPLIVHGSSREYSKIEESKIQGNFDESPTDYVPVDNVTTGDGDVEVDIL